MLPARRCTECGKLSVNAATCRFCGAEGGEAVSLSGRGRLVSWTVIRVPPARYAADAPYAVGLLELVDDPDHLTAGQPMGLVTLDPARGPIFR